MAEYIDRDAVLRDWPLCDEPADAYQFIRGFPAADVVEVVRCKDCMYWKYAEGTAFCESWNRLAENPDYYCAGGRR